MWSSLSGKDGNGLAFVVPGPRSNFYTTLQLVPKLCRCVQVRTGEEGRDADDVADFTAPGNISIGSIMIRTLMLVLMPILRVLWYCSRSYLCWYSCFGFTVFKVIQKQMDR